VKVKGEIKERSVSKKVIKKLVIQELNKDEKHQVKNVEDIMIDVSERYR
jgi:hypothetical protein